MKTEIEAKWLDIEPTELRRKLKSLGVQRVHSEILMRRIVFDFPDNRLMKKGGWVRVRDEGETITMSYKQLNDRTVHGTKEITFDINDFKGATELLTNIGLVQKSYQETKRERWQLGTVEVTIDTWPWIPTFVELEAPAEEALRQAAEQLGLAWSAALHGSVETAYQRYYDFTEAEIDTWPEITFIPEPDWLLAKKRT